MQFYYNGLSSAIIGATQGAPVNRKCPRFRAKIRGIRIRGSEETDSTDVIDTSMERS